MTKEEELELLRKQSDKAYEKFKANEDHTVALLLCEIDTCIPANLREHYHVSLSAEDRYWRDELCFRGTLQFKEVDPKRLENGYTWANYGEVDIYIRKDKIELNTGNTGTFDKNNIIQLGKLQFALNMFASERTIISTMLLNYNSELYQKYTEIERKVNQIETEIRNEKEERRKAELKKNLYASKFLYGHSTRNEYTWSDEQDRSIFVGVKHHYYDKFVIEKITKASVLGHYESYRWDSKRLKLSQVLADLNYGSLIATNDELKDYIEPAEEKEA